MEIDNAELEAEIKKRERLGSCEVCDQNEAKYTCPKCELHTCSLNCSRIHKKELECDGIRDKTKYIPVKKMTPMDFMNDYYFLEEATRFTKEIKTNWKVKCTKKLSNKFIKLKKAANQRNIKLFLLNSSLNKRKKNLSFYDPKADSIIWHVELNFTNADFKTRLKVNENTKIVDSIQSIIDKDENKKLEFYKAQGMSRLKVLLKAEGLKRNQNRYFDLNIKKSLKSNLSGKVVIEYPSISVVMDHCTDGYELIMSDDETIQAEQKEFVKTLQEEVFTRKVGENPMFIIKPEEVPIFADVLNDDNQKQAESSGNPQQSPTKSVITKDTDAKPDDDEEIQPENYFF
ncbi:box C/D snoRNA protein 1 [Chironomus tepperi]|uniref:box C/D snoRNA protein 1 n=1 Tax=Chironomus tepperi TaxID=113505 RepID=UPI00391EFEFE